MAVVSMMRFTGDPAELASKMTSVQETAMEFAVEHGGLGTITARTEDGIIVINLWKDEEGRQAMAEEPAILDALRAAELPPPGFQGYEVIDMTIRPEAVTA